MDPSVPEPLNSVLARAAAGEPDAWRLLVGTYSKRVFGLLVKQCGDRELAEEITQATFVKIVGHIGLYREQGKFEPWLFRIAMNRLRDEMRRRGRQARPMDMTGGRGDGDAGSRGSGAGGAGAWQAVQEQVVSAAGTEGSDHEDPAERVSRAEQVDRLKRAIEAMSEADRTVLQLRHTAGLSFAQIAETLDEPLGTVLARGHRALAKLKKLMEE
jgi:RNA polymerase sigma-70 factor (ECF subfamily)